MSWYRALEARSNFDRPPSGGLERERIIGGSEKNTSIGCFKKIFIDEAHHIYKPEIYYDDEDDIDEDEEDNDTYIDIIKSLKRFNNNIYLSATIDNVKDDNFIYYKKDKS